MTGTRTWFVTGASRGLGRAFVEAALDAGDAVVATARDPSSLTALGKGRDDHLLALALDVTDRASVGGAVQRAHDHFGRIDVLVNNAGYGLSGGVEEVAEEQVRRQFEVNVFGALWCTQAVLPIMRAQRRGHILQISSLGGVVAFPNTGLYHGTKWALEGISDALAQEVAGFGIRVTLVEPGPFRTDFRRDSMDRATPMPAYDDVLGASRDMMSGAHEPTQPGDPRKAAQAVLRVLASADPPLRLLLGAAAADLAPRVYRARLDEWATWDTVARGADFDA